MSGPEPSPFPPLAELVRPVTGDEAESFDVPLALLPAGDFAVLEWLDDLHAAHPARFGAEVEARLTAGWGELTPRAVHDLLAGGQG